jgi:FtsP/CotA-like multicopper oxidase with cupredoxin domain
LVPHAVLGLYLSFYIRSFPSYKFTTSNSEPFFLNALLHIHAMLHLTVAVTCLVGLSSAESAAVFARISPQYRNAFQYPLPIPTVKKPLTSFTNATTGLSIDFYEVEVKHVKHKFFPDIQGSADLTTYDGTYPGPTFEVEKGRETVVRFVNKATQKINVHLHGSFSTFHRTFLLYDNPLT